MDQLTIFLFVHQKLALDTLFEGTSNIHLHDSF